MNRTASVSSVAAAALVACTTIAEPPASQATVDRYVADARDIAGEDLKFLMPVCNPQPAVRATPGPAVDQMLA
jgi:metallo-beta-lactamase class B